MNQAESSSQAEREPQFFKIIQPHNLEAGILVIPQAFVSKYGKCLKRHVFLRVPKGGIHQTVELIRSNSRVWLQNGWQDFVDLFSVSCWYFLVFRDPYPVCDDDGDDDACSSTTVPMAYQLQKQKRLRAQTFISSSACDPHIRNSYLYVPVGDARRYLYGREDKSVEVRIGSGWADFVRGYHLQVKDTCVFELLLDLTTTTLMKFNVIIFRRAAA